VINVRGLSYVLSQSLALQQNVKLISKALEERWWNLYCRHGERNATDQETEQNDIEWYHVLPRCRSLLNRWKDRWKNL